MEVTYQDMVYRPTYRPSTNPAVHPGHQPGSQPSNAKTPGPDFHNILPQDLSQDCRSQC